MLSVVDKKGRMLGPLSAGDGGAMLAAFAQSGASAEAHEHGADMVRSTQQQECWFRCDCFGTLLPAPPRAPLSAPVPPRPAVLPMQAEVSPNLSLFGAPPPWPAAAPAVPVAAASRPPEPGRKLGRLAHRVLTVLRGKR